jgi:hypothetical protein
VTSLSDTPRFQYYDVQTLEYRYISKLPMKKERIWSNVKETTSHLQNKLTKNIHLWVATRSSTKWDCLKPIRFRMMWPISSCKKVRKCCNPHVYWWNRIGFKQSHFVEDLVATHRCMFLVSLFWRWDVVSLTLLHIRSFFIGNLLIYLYSKVWTS